MYKVFFTKSAEKELKRISRADAQRLLKKIDRLNCPFTSGLDIKKMISTEGFYRLRVGRMRVIFEIDEKETMMVIRKVGYRGSIYL